MQKTVVLKKTFTSESEYKHFESVYASAPNAFENSWEKKVFDDAPGAEVHPAKADFFLKFEAKVVDLAKRFEVSVDEAWQRVHDDFVQKHDGLIEIVEGVETRDVADLSNDTGTTAANITTPPAAPQEAPAPAADPTPPAAPEASSDAPLSVTDSDTTTH